MSKSENFKNMLEERPADALKYVEDFEQNAFWKYYQARMQKELDECDVRLRSCELSEVIFIRGFRKGIEYRVEVPAKVIYTLKEDIALLKAAEKVEAARKPEEK